MLQRLFAVLLAASTHAAACAQTPCPGLSGANGPFSGALYPGGNADMLVRLLSLKLTQYWDKPVVVENKPGASGTIAVNTVAKAEPDGHTLVLGAAGNLVVANKLIKGLPYDPVEDLKAVSVVATRPLSWSRPSNPGTRMSPAWSRTPASGPSRSPSARPASDRPIIFPASCWPDEARQVHARRLQGHGARHSTTWWPAASTSPSRRFRSYCRRSRPASCARWPSPARPALRSCPTCQPCPRRASPDSRAAPGSPSWCRRTPPIASSTRSTTI